MRKVKNWITGLIELAQEQEAPDKFWTWSALFTIASTLGRRVRLPFGMSPVLPNLFVILIASPGKARKGGPASLSKKFLSEVKAKMGVDSTTKASVCKELSENAQQFAVCGKFETHSDLVLISKELSSFLGTDMKNLIEWMTDIFDYHIDWEYRIKNGPPSRVYGPVVNFLGATTPKWLGDNVPFESLGYGWSSRVVFVSSSQKKGRITIPVLDYGTLYFDLVHDLSEIANLRGDFKFDPVAYSIFDEWYQRIDEKYDQIQDERFHDFIERMHINVLKVAMCYHVAYSDSLLLLEEDIQFAINLVEEILTSLPETFAGIGRNRNAGDYTRIEEQFKRSPCMSEGKVHQLNCRHLSSQEIKSVIDSLVMMGHLKVLSQSVRDGVVERSLMWQ